MLRRQARLRREYLHAKSVEIRRNKIQEKKSKVEKSLLTNTILPGEVQKDALSTLETLKYDYVGGNEIDDEYRFAGREDPKVVITTSHEPSARLKMFVKELKLIFPNAQKMNRGKYELKQLMHACRANNVTDFIIVHEHRGVPDNIIISHLPYGPTTFFNISGVVMRHDIPGINAMSEQSPHLIFHNFKTPLAKRVETILKSLFPVPKDDSKRVMTFANNDDYISFRHHTYQYVNKELQLTEIGPRFQLKLYQIKQGTLDELRAATVEWVYRPYMNTAVKRRFLSDEKGWEKQMIFQHHKW